MCHFNSTYINNIKILSILKKETKRNPALNFFQLLVDLHIIEYDIKTQIKDKFYENSDITFKKLKNLTEIKTK